MKGQSSGSESRPRHWVIVPAAGVGARMKADRPKQYLSLGGKAILEHTLGIFLNQESFSGIYLGVANEDPYWEGLQEKLGIKPAVFVGGAERSDTVRLGLLAIQDLAEDNDWVWVHDAARPCLSKNDLQKLFQQADKAEDDCFLLVSPVVDTVKIADRSMQVESTIDRTKVWRAMTPQVCRFGLLKSAIDYCAENQINTTDEASAVEAFGIKPKLVEGDSNNLKVTRPEDLGLANFIMKSSNENDMLPRIGNGFDVHAFEEGAFVTICGVEIPHSKGFKAHSDGDVALHALMDAILGALGLGDIGHHFPDTDECWRGADSRKLLAHVCQLMQSEGYRIGNTDLTVIAERPKLATHIETMRKNIAEDLSIHHRYVSVKATTSEKLGFAGREEGISAHATVLLFPSNH